MQMIFFLGLSGPEIWHSFLCKSRQLYGNLLMDVSMRVSYWQVPIEDLKDRLRAIKNKLIRIISIFFYKTIFRKLFNNLFRHKWRKFEFFAETHLVQFDVKLNFSLFFTDEKVGGAGRRRRRGRCLTSRSGPLWSVTAADRMWFHLSAETSSPVKILCFVSPVTEPIFSRSIIDFIHFKKVR